MAKFIVNDIKIISSWGYNLTSNTDCTICRCNLNNVSIYNQDKGIDSTILKGTCGHSFHEECIVPWVKKNKNCPICSNDWIVNKRLQPKNFINKTEIPNPMNILHSGPTHFQIPLSVEELVSMNSQSGPTNFSHSGPTNFSHSGPTNFSHS
jgi:hypothetical protein